MNPKQPMTKNKKHTNKIFYFFVFIFFIVLFFTSNKIINANPASRFLTMEAIVEEGSLNINKKNNTCDKIFREGNFYSSKPPVLSIIGSGAYFILNKSGLDFPEKENYRSEKSSAVYLLTLFLSGGAFFLLLIYFYLTLKLFNIENKYRIMLLSGLTMGTLYLPYSSVLNNHTIAGAFIFASFFYLLKIKFLEQNKYIVKNLMLSGFFASLGAAIDLPTGITFMGLFFIYLCINLKNKKYIYYYILAAIPVIIAHFISMFHITGDFLPVQFFHPEYYNYPGSYWNNPSGIDIEQQSTLNYSFNILLGSHGLFLYSPILLFPLYSMYKILRNKNNKLYKEAMLILSGFLIIFIFYSIKIKNFGGSAYGFRYFIALTPLFYFFTIFLFSNKTSSRFLNLFTVTLVISVLISSIGLKNPWATPGIKLENGHHFNSPLINNLMSISNNIFTE